jgi:hypothetical protein
MATAGRVEERRRAAALARYYREQEGLTIAEIARRPGRAEATVKAHLYDPSNANKGPSWEPEAKAGGRELRSHRERVGAAPVPNTVSKVRSCPDSTRTRCTPSSPTPSSPITSSRRRSRAARNAR